MRRLVSPTSLLVTVLCTVVAFGMSVLYRDYAVKAAVPLIFLIALVPVVHLSGPMASVLVVIMEGFIFAACLFEPYGSLAIRGAADRIEMLVFGVAALGVIHFSPKVGESRAFEPRRWRAPSVSVRFRPKDQTRQTDSRDQSHRGPEYQENTYGGHPSERCRA